MKSKELTFEYYIEVSYDLLVEVTGKEDFTEKDFNYVLAEPTMAGMSAGFLIGEGFKFKDIHSFAEDHDQYIKNKFGKQAVSDLFKVKREGDTK